MRLALPDDLLLALTAEAGRRGSSLEQTVARLLAEQLGVPSPPAQPASNGLGRFCGGWSEVEHAEFQTATAPFGEIDEELWT